MPTYNYVCNTCASDKAIGCDTIWISLNSGRLAWEVKHSIHEQPEIRCPICGEIASITLEGVPTPISYIKGNGYLDKDGCKRDMALYDLEKGDPYAQYRQSGETDHIKNNLRKAGRKGGKGSKQLGRGI